MFPFIDTAPRAVRPVAVLALIGANSFIFLWMWTLPPRALQAVLAEFALVPARYTDPVLVRYLGLNASDWWPLLTNTFMHGGWLHLGLNMWFLWIFGPAMEGRYGRLGFIGLYAAGGIAASFVHLATNPDSTVPVLGASGAVAAVLAAYAVTFPTARVVAIVPIWIIPLFIPVPAILFAFVWFALQVFQATYELASPGLAAGVAWWAHIGGFVFGALFAFVAELAGFDAHVRTAQWTSTRGKRVPDIRPRDWTRP